MGNQQTEVLFEKVIKLLLDAASAEIYASYRQRFASAEQWKVEGPAIHRDAAIRWLAAKGIICEHKDTFTKYLVHNEGKYTDTEIKNYKAALEVIDKEIETQFEQQFLKEETVGKKFQDQEPPYEEVEDSFEELDEDEEYVRQTSGDLPDEDEDLLWDGDDYLGDDEEEHFFDNQDE